MKFHKRVSELETLGRERKREMQKQTTAGAISGKS